MSKIVVSYRRSDSQAIAGRIVDRLIGQFGEHSVFMDVDNIPFGIDFRAHIQSALAQAQVLVAVVGPQWLGAGQDGNSRIQEEDDPVRVEIETALRQSIPVIPVLVNGAGMPAAAALPESLKNFAFLNAAPIDAGRDFRPHVDRLVQSIGNVLGRKPGAHSPAPARTRALIAGAALVLLLAGGVAAWQLTPKGTPTNPPAPTSAGSGATTPGNDEAQWAQIKDTTNPDQLRNFIQQYPDSAHRQQAESKLLILITHAGPKLEDDAWTRAKTDDTFAAYEDYLKTYPNGAHATEAQQAATEVRPVANSVSKEPAIGLLKLGESAIVDDHDPMCKRNEVKVVTGGDVTKTPVVYRTRKCVPRDQLP
jgi:hypothetical protein